MVIGCGILQLNARYPFKPTLDVWIMFPFNDEEKEESLITYFKTPKEQLYLSDALFAYLNRMDELGLK